MKKVLFALVALILAIPACALAGLGALARYESQHALRLQAEATLAQAGAIQTAQTMQMVLLALVLVLAVLLILALGGLAFFVWRGQQAPKRRWAPGPNAGWRRVGEEPQPKQLPDLNTLITLALVERLFPGTHPGTPKAALPSATAMSHQALPDDETDDDLWAWWQGLE